VDRKSGRTRVASLRVGVLGRVVVALAALEHVREEAEKRDEKADERPFPAVHPVIRRVEVRVGREDDEPRERDADEDDGDERLHISRFGLFGLSARVDFGWSAAVLVLMRARGRMSAIRPAEGQ